MESIEIILMIGTSGSGKSTWIRDNIKNHIIISADNIRKELTGSKTDKSADYEVYNILHKRIKQNLLKDKSVVVDTTNLKKERRLKILSIVQSINKRIIMKYKVMPLDSALAIKRIETDIRMKKDRANVSRETIMRHEILYLKMIKDIKKEGAVIL